MKDATIIRLSASALDKLFPEGTEARVQLQHAVLSEAARHFVKGALNDQLRAELTALIQKTLAAADLDELIAKNFLRKGYTGDLVPRPDGKVAQAIGEAVRQKVTEEVHEYVAKCVDQQIADAVEKANQHAEYVVQRHLHDGTANFLKQRVDEAWQNTIKQLAADETSADAAAQPVEVKA